MEKTHGKVEALCEQYSGGNDAVAFCRQCTEFICLKCSEAHKMMKTFAHHKVVSMEDLKKRGSKQVSVTDPPPPPMCSVYEEMLKIYCYDCDCLICRDCTVIDHKDHKYEFVKKAAKGMEVALAEQLSPLKQVHTSIKDALMVVTSTKNSVESQGTRVAETIEKSFQEFFDIINHHKRELLAKASSFTEGKLRQLSTQEDKLKFSSGMIKSVVDFVEQDVERMTDEELMSVSDQIMKQVNNETRKHQNLLSITNLSPVEKADMAVVVATECNEELRKLCQQKIKIVVSKQRQVVWVDPNIDNFENSGYVHYLRAVEGIQLHATSNPREAIKELSNMQQGTEYRIITAGTGGNEFVQRVRKMGVHCPILVFCLSEEWHKKWACRYNNVEVTASPRRMYDFATWNRYH